MPTNPFHDHGLRTLHLTSRVHDMRTNDPPCLPLGLLTLMLDVRSCLFSAGVAVILSGIFVEATSSSGNRGSGTDHGSMGDFGCYFDVDKLEIEADLNAFIDRFNELSAPLDVESLVALYDVDSLWIDSENPPIPGREGALSTFGFLEANNGSFAQTVDRVIISDDGNQAVVIGEADVRQDGQGLGFTATVQYVLVRGCDDWKIVVDMFNMHAE